MSDAVSPKPRRREFWMILALCAAPVIGSYALYYLWKPSSLRNYGELLDPAQIEAKAGSSAAPLAPLKGRWVLIMVDSADCAPACQAKLWQMRQVRLTQGKEMERVERAWLVDDGGTPSAEVLREYAGTVVVKSPSPALLGLFTAPASARDHLYLIDPLGNLMMRFPREADPQRIRKDLGHLLKVSRIG
ncbi:MAG: SCO family protein [Betaproteobacteria bacterium]|jgi:hypothetical protein|nr:cytochrome C oxidase subunit I [Rhodocyclaceae bacterium]MCA3135899.1 cytochrome C oxidase subunit I [Rhodocyclaceae bacterium]MCA3140818.1 cytochrome C oxidase subunit I [Rhodocyclaceae bacterium]MCA3146005.1 cytochrome C oxidase subunit I [Rhodocyclaceae bacterium]MCE2899328.1 cytochrome C oxidase subunit I [Betaproteobacteria bacterium]